MSNLTIIENKISGVKKYLKILEKYQRYTQNEIENDIDKKGALERYLYLAVQATIELAESVVAYKKLRKPSTMSEAFEILKEEKILSADVTKRMIEITGFRNVIAHDYEKIDYRIVYEVLQNGTKDVEKFLTCIKRVIL